MSSIPIPLTIKSKVLLYKELADLYVMRLRQAKDLVRKRNTVLDEIMAELESLDEDISWSEDFCIDPVNMIFYYVTKKEKYD